VAERIGYRWRFEPSSVYDYAASLRIPGVGSLRRRRATSS
jgi:hypothetical protein